MIDPKRVRDHRHGAWSPQGTELCEHLIASHGEDADEIWSADLGDVIAAHDYHHELRP